MLQVYRGTSTSTTQAAKRQRKLRILPRYSPFLNIVQQAISCPKANFKAYISRPAMQERFADRNAAKNAHLLLGINVPTGQRGQPFQANRLFR